MILVNYSQSHNMLIENEIGRGMVNYITGSLYRGAVHVVLRNDSTTRSASERLTKGENHDRNRLRRSAS